jgi:hypothetical protein
MSTTDSFPRDFLLVFAVGGVITTVVGWWTRRLLRTSLWCRGLFCILLGATVAPALFPVLGDLVIAPAAFMLLLVSEGGKNALIGICYGGPPVILTAALIFSLWTFRVRRLALPRRAAS